MVVTLPSAPIPETPERRAEIMRNIQAATGLDEMVLERLVRRFYHRARRDAVIGHLFDGVQDWERHIAKITLFWSSVALLTGRYHGQPLPPHFRLGVQPLHFKRWLMLFEQTVREECSPAATELLMDKARRIARSMEVGVAVARGELPPRTAARS
jgi:hemoglobin